MSKGNGLHIFLWEGENTDKAYRIGSRLGDISPNKFFNKFFSEIDEKNFIETYQQLMREDHMKIKILIEPASDSKK